MGAFAPDQPAFYAGDPHAEFRRLRRGEPVHWYEGGGFWCITRHADLQRVSRSPQTFSSSQGTQLFEIALRRRGAAPPDGQARAILQMDPPEHRRYRRLLVHAFTPRRVALLEPGMRQLARDLIDRIGVGKRVDFVEALAAPLPLLVIAELLGVPADDRDDFRRWSDALVEAGGAEALTEQTRATIAELFAYFRDRLAERRLHPRDDLMSLFVTARIDGEPFAEPDALMFCLTLLVAGNETTRNLISGGTWALMHHPDQLQTLRREPTALPNAIEEMLRWWTPVQTFVRRTVRDTELRGQRLQSGDYLVLFYGSANRDEEVFGADSDAFDIARKTASRHVAFGFGEHLCLGAALARLEARVLFEELLRRGAAPEPAGPIELLPSVLMHGVERMPVVLQP